MLSSIEDGSKALLEDVATVLRNFASVEYIVIGGWCPVLRNTTKIKHPGTLDVDLLFKDSYKSGTIGPVIKALMDAGFRPSAKHPFQLLKSQEIKGEKFVFNVDLLHPKMLDDKDSVGMFVDHLELDVPLNANEITLKKIKSIVLSNSEILFSENLYSKETIGAVDFNLISFDGMFLTKMDSCQKQKRERDSFDIYLGFLGGCIDITRIKILSETDERIFASVNNFRSFLKDNRDLFNSNVKMFSHVYEGSPASLILERLNGLNG